MFRVPTVATTLLFSLLVLPQPAPWKLQRLEVLEEGRINHLEERFNADSASARLLVVLSPT